MIVNVVHSLTYEGTSYIVAQAGKWVAGQFLKDSSLPDIPMEVRYSLLS